MIKRLLVIFAAAILALSFLLCSCGEEQKNESKDESAVVQETTVILETTSDGGTMEQDSEGNKITKDHEGKVTKVEDKTGNPIDITVYLTTHSWIEAGYSSDGSSGGSSDRSGSSGGSGSSFDSNDDMVEESLPVIIATMPDDDDLIEVPDL